MPSGMRSRIPWSGTCSPDPDRQLGQRHRSASFRRDRHRQRGHRPVDGRHQPPARDERSAARLLRLQWTSGESATCRATPSQLRRHPGVEPPIGTLNYTHIFGPTWSTRPGSDGTASTSPSFPSCRTIHRATGSTTASRARSSPPDHGPGCGPQRRGAERVPQGRIDTTMVFSDTLSYLKGRHSFKLGGEYRRFKNSNFGTTGETFTYPSLADFQAAGLGLHRDPRGPRQRDRPQASACSCRTTQVRSNLPLDSASLGPHRVAYRGRRQVRLLRSGHGLLYRAGQNRPRDKTTATGTTSGPVGIVWDPFEDGVHQYAPPMRS